MRFEVAYPMFVRFLTGNFLLSNSLLVSCEDGKFEKFPEGVS